ncbi:peptidoglycan-binding protein [Calothrix sp. 336/3]|uniref:peptidoglycan-binding protein n=1 Tax=Calothrix sp. 336/3 TaxID=1337936 RepID=UPI000624EF75|nr:hypothetical protein IJ00_05850 [Calothrix sp. 336/3]
MTCFSFNPAQASKINNSLTAQATVSQSKILKPGGKGKDVSNLQENLKELGYFSGSVDGNYSDSTKQAVAKFQKSQGLQQDGIAGTKTQQSLQAAVEAKKSTVLTATTPSPQPSAKPQSGKRNFFWWSFLAIALIGGTGLLLYLVKFFGKTTQTELEASETEVEPQTQAAFTPSPLEETPEEKPEETLNTATKLLPPATTSHLVKVNIIDELIGDLSSHDPNLRRKAIWDLGQQGDSRAVQPLVDLLSHTDSQQRSLILAAISEIGIRTLKPMNRALAVSLQDESPQVRQNAIRDLTRVYDMMAQISQMLCHAAEDRDTEVQATAKYALMQMNRIRGLPEQITAETSDSQDTHRNNFLGEVSQEGS